MSVEHWRLALDNENIVPAVSAPVMECGLPVALCRRGAGRARHDGCARLGVTPGTGRRSGPNRSVRACAVARDAPRAGLNLKY